MQKQKSKTKQKQDLIQMVDDAYIIDTEIKEKSKILKTQKDKLKKVGKNIKGELGECVISNETKTEIDPKKFYELLIDLNMEAAFWDLITVKVGDARKRVGDLALGQIWEQNVKKNSKIVLKKRN